MGLISGGLITKVLVTTGITASVVAGGIAFSGQGDLDAIKGKYDQASNKIEELVGKTNDWKSYTLNLQNNFTNSVGAANAKINEMKAKNAKLEKTIFETKALLALSIARTAQLEADKIKLIDEKNALQASLNTKTEEYNSEVSAHAATKAKLEAEIAALKDQIANLQSQIEAKNAELQELEAENQALESEIVVLETKKTELENNLVALEAEANQMIGDLATEANDALNKLGDDAQAEINRLEGEVGKANNDSASEIGRLEAEVENANDAVKNTADYVNGVDISGKGASDVSEVSGYKPPTVVPVNVSSDSLDEEAVDVSTE